MKALVTFAVLLNVLGLAVFGWLRFQTTVLGPLAVSARYTELDRAQVIDAQRLAQTFPNLAGNSRHLVPEWLTSPVVGTGQSLTLYALILAALNLAIVLLLARGLTGKAAPAPTGR
jgi:hypothetical protein